MRRRSQKKQMCSRSDRLRHSSLAASWPSVTAFQGIVPKHVACLNALCLSNQMLATRPPCHAQSLNSSIDVPPDLCCVFPLQPDRTAFVAPVVVKPASDPRLQRLAQRRREPGSDSDDSEEGAGDRRRAAARRHAAIADEAERAAPGAGSSEEEDSSADEEGGDDEDIAARRAAVKARQATRSPRAGTAAQGVAVHKCIESLTSGLDTAMALLQVAAAAGGTGAAGSRRRG